MSESKLVKYFLSNIDHVGHFCPVEAHVSQPGIPDYCYTIGGLNGWIEFKYGTKKRPPELRMMQYVWFQRNTKNGGNPLIIVCLHVGDQDIFGIIHGSDVYRVYKTNTLEDWYKAMKVKWQGKINWSEMVYHLKNPQLLAR